MNKPKSTSELLSAPTQKALEEILQDSRSDDACTRLLAFERFTEVFRKFIGPDPAESTMHMAAKLLEKGFLKAIAGGLDECVADPWKLLGGGANPDDCDVLQIQSETGRSAEFLNAVMRHALRHFEDRATVLGSITLLLSLRRFLSEPALEENLFRIAGRVLSESSETMLIKFTITMLHGVEYTRLLPKGYLFKPLATNSALRSAALALVLCAEQLADDDHALMFLLARALEYGTLNALAAGKCPPPGVTIDEDLERIANADLFARKRARELRTLLAEEIAADGDGLCVRFMRPKASEGARGLKISQQAEKMGMKLAERKKATRCSGPGCDGAETRPGEFQTCGGCKLAVYCGRACQRRAWKAGHKEVCQKRA